MTRGKCLALAAVLAAVGIAWLTWPFQRQVEVQGASVAPETGHAFILHAPGLPPTLLGDTNEHPRRSPVQLRENGVALGPAHSMHDEIRLRGAGRYSHWHAGLIFSASDNSDPRSNGRAYALAYEVRAPSWFGYLCLVAAVVFLLRAEGRTIARDARVLAASFLAPLRRSRSTTMSRWTCVHLGVLGALIAGLLWLGFERSAWILVTQPVETLHSTNSMLGYTFIRDGSVLHKENHSALQQVAWFSGADAPPDMYFRRPIYGFLAALLAPVAGTTAALVIVNLLAWCMAVWLCHRFTRRFYEDTDAANWAALFAIGGLGFVVHVLDLSAHLLAFTFYMAGVVVVYESECWRRRVPLRTHAVIAVFLMIACLQYNTGIALVAAYVVVAIRHNPPWLVLGAALLSLSAQPLWGHLIGAIFQHRHGVPLHDLASTELEYFRRSLKGWREIFSQKPADVLYVVAMQVWSFLFFENPLVVLLGGARLVADLREPAGRRRAAFALPFIAFPLLAALLFATSASARGYLVYGIAIFFIAGCGATIARLVRRRPRAAPMAGLVVVVSLAWSTAHVANFLGPAKAYYVGMLTSQHLLRGPAWEAESLTGNEPAPRLFGGSASLAEAGLSARLAPYPGLARGSAGYAMLGGALFVVLVITLVMLATPASASTALLLGAAVLGLLGVSGLTLRTEPPILITDAVQAVRPDAPVTYEIALSPRVRERLVAGLKAGQLLVLFPGQYRGGDPPSMSVGSVSVALDRKFHDALWVLDSAILLRALQSPQGDQVALRFPGGTSATLGGWQRTDLSGRRLSGGDPKQAPTALPAVELRLVRDAYSMALLFVAF